MMHVVGVVVEILVTLVVWGLLFSYDERVGTAYGILKAYEAYKAFIGVEQMKKLLRQAQAEQKKHVEKGSEAEISSEAEED